jgi:hypothetical protein
MHSFLLRISLVSCVLGLGLSITACGGTETTDDPEEDIIEEEVESKAQVVFLTQDFPYDDDHKDSIAGPYIQQTKLDVPSDLSPQNKWVMFEGPVLENDRVAYRFYMDSRHRYDIYGKRVADLVMDTVSWDYHDIMDWGSDILKVGNSLGMGTPAIYYKDKIYHLGDADAMTVSTRMTDAGCAQVETLFSDVSIENGEPFSVIETTTLCPGNRHAAVQVKTVEGALPEGAAFCTGVVKHDTELQTSEANDSRAVFSWGKQSFHGENMGMAVLAKAKQVDRHQEDPLSHLLLFKPGLSEVNYSFMSAWERDVIPVKTQAAFEEAIRTAAK